MCGIAAAFAACDFSTWAGPGSNLSVTPKPGGDATAAGAHFGTWVNNAWGPASTLLPLNKEHPALQGVQACVVEYPALPCAVGDASGRIDIYGIPASKPVHIAFSLRGYYGLLLPFDPTAGDFVDQPAIEMPSLGLQAALYQQLLISEKPGTGGINVFAVDSAELHPGDAPDHSEANGKRAGVGFKYRRVYVDASGAETYGEWTSPASWVLSHHSVVYLNNDESPDLLAMHTSDSGLALAVNLEPGLYEAITDDTNFTNGLQTLWTGYHWNCGPVNHTPSAPGAPRIARTLVQPGQLSDIRVGCVSE